MNFWQKDVGFDFETVSTIENFELSRLSRLKKIFKLSSTIAFIPDCFFASAFALFSLVRLFAPVTKSSKGEEGCFDEACEVDGELGV